jgi:large subunit ribosomal protein L22
MPGPKTNERPGTRATLRHCRMSAYKARAVLDLIRGVEYRRAEEILEHCERSAATVIAKLLRSAAANAENNDSLDREELFVSACYADEGPTLKRWRPRARGRATRRRKRSCHITVILSRLPEDELRRRRVRAAAEAAERRARRVAGARQARGGKASAAAAPEGEARPESEAPAASEAAAAQGATAQEAAEAHASGAETAVPAAEPAGAPAGDDEAATEDDAADDDGEKVD